ncbi:MAG: carotenoid biosynthesis protein, partial [Abditibacteriales bacterium]|nr:carotenoid biosynthesis protein [Abditibacteriales bacterium]
SPLLPLTPPSFLMSRLIVAFLLILIAASGLAPQRPPDHLIMATMLCWSTAAFVLSVQGMGWKNAGLFFVLALSAAFVAEYVGVNYLHLLTHQVQPQIANVPTAILLGWYVALAASYALASALWRGVGAWGAAVGTGMVATIYDLVVDPLGLAQGWWVWHQGGSYAPSVLGANNIAGIPWGNFVGWFVLASGVTLLFEWLIQRERFYTVRFDLRWSALFYFALCLPGITWALFARQGSVLLTFLLPWGVLGLLTGWQLVRRSEAL